MTVKLKNISGEVGYLGRPDGKRVDVGEVIEVEGSVIKDGPDDAITVGTPAGKPPDPPKPDADKKALADYAAKVREHDAALSTHRAYPTSLWAMDTTRKGGDSV